MFKSHGKRAIGNAFNFSKWKLTVWENSALFYPREFFKLDEIVFRNWKQDLILFTWISFCSSLEMVVIKLLLSFDPLWGGFPKGIIQIAGKDWCTKMLTVALLIILKSQEPTKYPLGAGWGGIKQIVKINFNGYTIFYF